MHALRSGVNDTLRSGMNDTLLAGVNDTLLAGLSVEQRTAVTCPQSPVCILAGAGSGKTGVLSRRIAWRVAHGTAEPGHTLALTFTSRAATELADRLKGLGMGAGVTTGTFHSVALAQLRRRWADASRRPAAVLKNRPAFLRCVVEESGVAAGASPGYLEDASAELSAEISWAKARSVDSTAYAAAAKTDVRRGPLLLTTELVAELFESYERRKRKRGVVDFDDLVEMCADAMEGDPLFAGAQRWRFRHLFVDEAQDLNPAQWRLLDAWLGGRDDVCVVGDLRQAIYGWNGAAPDQLAQFAARPTTTLLHLNDNWRCTPQVLACATAALDGGTMQSDDEGGAAWSSHPPSTARAEPGPIPTLTCYADERAEARGVAGLLTDAVGRGHQPGDCAVLARTNAQLVPVREALAEAGIAVAGEAGGRGVDVLTFHRSKGLEWAVVVLVGMVDGVVPLAGSEGPVLEEERRLVYVAMTRAARELHCTWFGDSGLVQGRSVQGRTLPSPFVAHLPTGERRTDQSVAYGRSGRQQVQSLRRLLGVPSSSTLTGPSAGATTGP